MHERIVWFWRGAASVGRLDMDRFGRLIYDDDMDNQTALLDYTYKNNTTPTYRFQHDFYVTFHLYLNGVVGGSARSWTTWYSWTVMNESWGTQYVRIVKICCGVTSLNGTILNLRVSSTAPKNSIQRKRMISILAKVYHPRLNFRLWLEIECILQECSDGWHPSWTDAKAKLADHITRSSTTWRKSSSDARPLGNRKCTIIVYILVLLVDVITT